MDTLTERLERLAELQKKNIEPLQSLGSSAFVAFERMARKNYELMGDMVDYAVAQTRGSIEPNTPQALYERQMAEARAFAERMSARTAEYVALAEQLRDEASLGTSADPAPSAAVSEATGTARNGGSDGHGTASTGVNVTGSDTRETDAREGSTEKAAAERPTGGKKTAAKKAAGKKSAGKKAAAKKSAGKKSAGKKATGKRAATKKSSAKKTATKKKGSKKGTSR